MIQQRQRSASEPGFASPLRWVVAVGVTCLVTVAAGCSVSTTTIAPSDGNNPYGQANVDEPDAGYESDAETIPARNGSADASASDYRGSSLCYATNSASTCFPDTAPQAAQCTTQRAPSTDAGTSNTTDGAAGVPSTVACHVVSASNGAVPAPACLVAGPGHDGDQCLKPTDCAAGFECVGSPGQCRHYCCDGTCGKAQFCDIQTVADVGSLKVPVCAPVRSCKLLSQMGCGQGETCAVVNADDGTTSCVATGPAQVGQSCEVAHCGEHLTCLGQTGSRRCYQLCDKTASTPCSVGGEKCKGSAPLFNDANTGVCQK